MCQCFGHYECASGSAYASKPESWAAVAVAAGPSGAAVVLVTGLAGSLQECSFNHRLACHSGVRGQL